MKKILSLLVLLAIFINHSCGNKKNEIQNKKITKNLNKDLTTSKLLFKNPPTPLTSEFKNYWYANDAEISSFNLKQLRYGEIRKGHAVLIFVTEDFLPKQQVKADTHNKANTSVLKLNTTKKFKTGIYPYSIMESTFYPVANNTHAIKVSASVQEWCGHVYAQLNNRDVFEVMSHSYFQNEADQYFKLEKTWTENELWIKLRINPEYLPTGSLQIITPLEYSILHHENIKAYAAVATLKKGSYNIIYPSLNRSLTITFNPNFPYNITGWEETTLLNDTSTSITTKASLIKTIKSDYWNKNSNMDIYLRDSLNLN